MMMRRLSSPDDLAAVVSLGSTAEEEKWSVPSKSNGESYSHEGLKSVAMDGFGDEDCIEECGQIGERKRRLSCSQVKALEKYFEVENKLEPKRKTKLAQELGLQPRQVAIWFQNRRARWKTKKLEKDYSHLKSSYDALQLNFDALQHDKQALLAEIGKLKMKLQLQVKDKANSGVSNMVEDNQNQGRSRQNRGPNSNKNHLSVLSKKSADDESFNNNPAMVGKLKDKSFDESDCSVTLNDEKNPPNTGLSSSNLSALANTHKPYHQLLRMEEQSCLNAVESCDFFLDEHLPFLSWFSSDQQWI